MSDSSEIPPAPVTDSNGADSTPSAELDPAATEKTSETARNRAEKRRDPDQPVAVVGIGASAGGIAPLQQFFEEMKTNTGLAFVVVMHLSPDFESQLAEVIQQKTKMPVVQVTEAVKVQPNHVYVIPPNHQLTFEDSMLRLLPPQQAHGRRVTIDLFFRTLAHAYGQRAVSIIMSGTDSDGVIGLKHIRAQGGVTVAQEPEEAEFNSMPQSAINTGMVDWVLRVGDMPRRLLEFVRNENAMQLPPEIPEANEPGAKVEEAPGGETVSDETRDPDDEEALLLVLKQVRARTGHDFDHYKRATVLRRIARRMQVTSIESIPRYLDFLREHEAEARALMHDLLIGVTHFFRDQGAFAALEANIPQLFAGKKPSDELRVWVTGCATGEEAYSIAMLLCEHAERLSEPPSLQIFATDLDEQSIQEAREGVYPTTIDADVLPERLREFFVRDNGRYRVKKHIRDKVLFARHNVLSDPAFSRVDLVSCRNLLIYLNREAQARVFDVFHFALRAGGVLFIGGAESVDGSHTLFSPLDNHHRIYMRRSVPRPTWRIPTLPARVLAPDRRHAEISRPMLPEMTSGGVEGAGEQSQTSTYKAQQRRSVLFGELHLKLLEEYGPPSVVVNEAYDIVHLSENAGRYLSFRAGEPSTNLMTVVNPALRVELRTALFRSGQSNETVIVPALRVPIAGETENVNLQVRPIRPGDTAHGFFLILFEKRIEPLTNEEQKTERATISRQVGDELQSLKEQLNATVEQFEVSTEELRASNEELQAMNEELRSAAEELETSKEELQSVNEELITVNQELKEKVEELSRANSDLNNLMTSTDLATIFLDRKLRVVRFTPRVQDLFNLLPADMGRPISDITHKLHYDTLTADAERVLDRLASIEREIETDDARTFLSRIAPYRTLDDKISGVVVTLIDVTQIKRAQAEVRAGTERYRTLFDLVPVAVYTTDAEGVIQEYNDHAVELWGRTPQAGEKYCGSFKMVNSDGRTMPHDECPMARVLDGKELEPEELEVLVEQESGKRFNVMVAPRALKNANGTIVGAINCFHDISSRKQIEQALRESEERYRSLFERMDEGFCVIEVLFDDDQRPVDYRFLETNPAFEKHTGIKQAVGARMREIAPNHEEHWFETYGRIALTGQPERFQNLAKELNRFYDVYAFRAGQPEERKVAVLFQDITDRRQIEQALRESEERFRTVADNVPQLIWTNDGEGTANYFNKRWFDYSGLSYEESHGPGWQAMVHPEDEPAAVKRWQRALAQGEVFDAEYRLRGADGGYRWFIGRNVPMRDNGTVLSWFGTATDIDDLKRAQAHLGESEERFRVLVEGARDYAMFLLDPGNVITFWSNGAERVFGWAREEVMGQSGDLIFTPEDKKKGAVEGEIKTAMRDGRAPDRRFHLRKDGTRFWADGVLMRLDDDAGQPRGFAKVARDASDQHEIEDQLRHARDELEQRVVERTTELMNSNMELQTEIATRHQLERDLLEISERERRRIGQDLHDIVCQELTATALFLKSSGNKVTDEVAARSLDEAAQIVNRNVGLARDLARGFQAVLIGSGGLTTALRSLCAKAHDPPEITCTLKLPRAIRIADETIALNLYRIAQEAVTNATKHADATEIVICVERERDFVRLVVEDNGKGFKTKKRSKGLGLHIMLYRASVLGGHLTVESPPKNGTRVVATVPIPKKNKKK